MPEVIDLLSSTPPPPEEPRTQQRVQIRPAPPHPNPPPPTGRSILSDDSIDISGFNYDGLDKPAKKRRISEELELSQPAFTSPLPPPRQDPPRATTFTSTSTAINRNFIFSDDDLGLLAPAPQSELGSPSLNALESDPIVFTSSAPDPAKSPAVRKTTISRTNTITIDDDDDEVVFLNDEEKPRKGRGNASGRRQEEIEEFSDPFALPDLDELLDSAGDSQSNSMFSSKTASLLASLDARPKGVAGRHGAKASRSRSEKQEVDELSDEVAESKRPLRKTTSKTTSKLTGADKEAKAREREANKAQREREKELEKERKQKLKDEKAKEKQLAQDMAEVNKLKVNKKLSTPEMILDIASSFEETSVGNQTTEFMKRLSVVYSFFTSPIPNIIKWRRKVTARFNETAGHWEPCQFHIRQEEHIMCLLPAQDFVDMVISTEPETESIEEHVTRIKTAYPNCKPIYVIEALGPWMRKNKNSRNRAYQAEVRRQFEQDAPSTSTATSRRKKANKPETTPPVDDDTIEDALLRLQVTHACLIHHTNAAPESAEWIKNFTEHVSTIPYRLERMTGNDSAFCMDVGQVKSGEDKTDTFVKMLQEVNRITASMAYGIIPKYPSVMDLVRAMRVQGPAMLEDVKKSANKSGALTDSRIGPAASKRLYKVFTGLDPSSTDI